MASPILWGTDSWASFALLPQITLVVRSGQETEESVDEGMFGTAEDEPEEESGWPDDPGIVVTKRRRERGEVIRSFY